MYNICVRQEHFKSKQLNYPKFRLDFQKECFAYLTTLYAIFEQTLNTFQGITLMVNTAIVVFSHIGRDTSMWKMAKI